MVRLRQALTQVREKKGAEKDSASELSETTQKAKMPVPSSTTEAAVSTLLASLAD
jgi:hypothetical protein